MSKDPRLERIEQEIADWEPGPCPDDFGREATSKPKPVDPRIKPKSDPRIRKPKIRRGPGL